MNAKTKFLRKIGASPHYSDRQLALWATLTAVAANLVFWGVLFKHRDPDAAVRDSTASVELLRLDSGDGGSMRRWIVYHDPAKNGSSAYPGGFSAQLPVPELFKLPVTRPVHAPELAVPGVRKLKLLTPPEYGRVPTAGLPLAGTGTLPERGAAPGFPTASDDLGRNIRIVGGVPPKGAGAVTGDTMLRVTRTGGGTNLVVWMSCGDKTLDGHAAGMVAAAVSELDPPPAYVNISWPFKAESEVEK